MPAQRGEITFAGDATLVPGDGVVQVAAGGGPAAARGGAPGAAGADQVLEFAAGPVAGLGVGVVAVAAGDRDQAGAQAAQVILRPGAVRRVTAESGTAGDSEGGAARWRVSAWGSGAGWGVAAGEAGVRGGGAIGVQGGDAPARAGVLGGGGDEVAGVGGVDQAERADLAGGLGRALDRLERHGDRDQRRDARPGIVAGAPAGTARAVAPARAAGAVVPVRTARAAGAVAPVGAA